MNHKNAKTEFNLLRDIATIRTGVVTTRKKAPSGAEGEHTYSLVNLHCIQDDGTLDLNSIEQFHANEDLSDAFITRKGDILIRLSAPYTSVIIDSQSEGLLVPSHFAIVRITDTLFNPYFVLWQLRQKSVLKRIYQNVSGTIQFGTINSGLFGDIPIERASVQKQSTFSEIFKLAENEKTLLERLTTEKKKFNQALMAYAFKNLK